jgi:phosphoglycolate phosphatase-like HAD superfamily hydrolase
VILARLGWRERIDASIASDEVDRGRPYPDMILELMRRFDVSNPSRVAKVGDTPADLEEGDNAGCGLIVGVIGGTHTRGELEPIRHTHLIEDIPAFPGLLGFPTKDPHV